MQAQNRQSRSTEGTATSPSNRSTRPAIAIVVLLGFYLLITSTFYPLDFLTVFDAKRVLQLVLFTLTLLFAVAWSPLRKHTIAQLSRLSVLNWSGFVLFFLIGLVSSLGLEHPGYALVDVAMLFVILILIAVTAASRDLSGRIFDNWAVGLLAILGFAVAIQELMGFVSGWVLQSEFNYTQAFVHFAHPRFYNQLQTWSIPVLAALPFIFPDKRWIKSGCIILLALQWFLVIAVAARGTVVSLLTAMAFIALWLPDMRRFWLKYQLAGLLAGILIYSGVLLLNGLLIPQSRSGEFFVHSVGRSMAHTSGRSTFWRVSVEDAIKHPALGAGPTRFACDHENANKFPAHPHSFLFRILSEWGWLALILLFTLAVTIGSALLRNLKYPDRAKLTDQPLRTMLATSLIAGFIHACLSGLLTMPASQVAMILITGWVLSLTGATRLQAPRSVVAGLTLTAGVVVISATLVFSIKEIVALPDRTDYSEQMGPMAPRFWQDGKVCEYNYVDRALIK